MNLRSTRTVLTLDIHASGIDSELLKYQAEEIHSMLLEDPPCAVMGGPNNYITLFGGQCSGPMFGCLPATTQVGDIQPFNGTYGDKSFIYQCRIIRAVEWSEITARFHALNNSHYRQLWPASAENRWYEILSD